MSTRPFGLCGLVFIGISIPLVFEKIPPNSWYGFRVPKTLSNREIWYKANKFMGKDFILLGGILFIYNLAVFALKPAFASSNSINMILLIGGTGVVIIRSLLYLRQL